MYSLGTCKYCNMDKLRMINTSRAFYRVICLNCVKNWKAEATAMQAKQNYERDVRK